MKGDTAAITPQEGTIIIGCVNLATTIVAIVLVEVAGRRTLLLIAFAGMTVITAIVAIVLVVEVCIVCLKIAWTAIIICGKC